MRFTVLSFIATVVSASGTAWGVGLSCPPDAVPVGNICVDKYEASVWRVDPTTVAGKGLIRLIQGGRATLADLTSASANALQLSYGPSCILGFPVAAPGFPENGQWTAVSGSNPPSPGVYAVSVAGVLPTACVTWWQAAEACRLSGKRLLTNLEWQDAAAGTPDPGYSDNGSTTCATQVGPANTGARTNCKSRWGAFDMVGNVEEWVADWVPHSTDCPGWGFSDDYMCLSGASTTESGPGMLIRGGYWGSGLGSGVFAVSGLGPSGSPSVAHGFRCAR